VLKQVAAMESLPAWDDKPGVAKLADRLLADHDALAQRYIDFVERIEDIRQPFIEPSEITTGAEYEAMVQFAREVTKFKKAERAAVAAFHRGDRKPLQALVWSSYYSGWLDPSAHALLGKRKKRIRKHPNHDAAREAGVIRQFLRRLYPQVRPAEVRARAIAIAAERAHVDVASLRQYLNRPRGDPHRLPSI